MLEGGELMAEKSARSKEVESEVTVDQVKEQLLELGKKEAFNVRRCGR